MVGIAPPTAFEPSGTESPAGKIIFKYLPAGTQPRARGFPSFGINLETSIEQ